MAEDKTSHVLIIGYGEMGHAMQYLLEERHQLSIYDARLIEGLEPVNLERKAASADFILFCIPSQPLQKMLQKIGSHLQNHTI